MKKTNYVYLILVLFFCLGTAAILNLKAQTVDYEIFALKFGERTHKVPVTDIAVGAKSNDSVNVCFMYWLLKGSNGKVILVDAGFGEDAEINPKYIRYTLPDQLLEKINLKASDITDIIITHPHWDHIGGISLYPNAMVWMQEKDYGYFVGEAWQKEGNNGGCNKADVTKIVQRNLDEKLTLIQGDDKEIFPGIRVFTGSKHTYESQFVLVSSGKDKVIIASDNSWFYYNLSTGLPIPITLDSKAYAKNLKRMLSMVRDIDHIIPGHDPLVFTKFPTVAQNIVKIK